MIERHSKILLASVVLLIFMGFLFATEAYLSLFARADEQQAEGNPRTIRLREHAPESAITFVGPVTNVSMQDKPQKTSYQLSIDKDGFIYPSAIHPDPDLKIVFLGGSTTECLYMKEDERFPYLVGRYIEHSTFRVNSYNGGVSGNNSMHSLNILVNKVLPIEPDYVVLMHNINDLIPLMYYGTYWNDTPTRSLVVTRRKSSSLWHLSVAVKIAIKGALPNIYRALKQLQDRFEKNDSFDEWQAQRSVDLVIDEEHIKESFRRSLLTFVHIARVHSVVPILMTQARKFELSQGKKEDNSRWLLRTKLFDAFNEIIREVGTYENVHVIDLSRLIPKDDQHMYDSLHYTPKGSEFVAKVITQYFEANLLLN